MKAKIILLLSVIMLTSVNAFASEYKGSINEKHAKKANCIAFGVRGTCNDVLLGGIFAYDSHINFYKLHNYFYVHYSTRDTNGNNLERLYIEFQNSPYIEKDIDGKITLIGQCYYSYTKAPDISNTKENCRLFITLTPTTGSTNTYCSYLVKIYDGAENTKPLIEQTLDMPYFYEAPFGNSDYRKTKTKSECYKFFWIWLEHISNKLK